MTSERVETCWQIVVIEGWPVYVYYGFGWWPSLSYYMFFDPTADA